MERTAIMIIKDVIHVFASISKIMLILLMGRRNRERCIIMLILSPENKHVTLIHCGLVTPYGGIDLGQHWLR